MKKSLLLILPLFMGTSSTPLSADSPHALLIGLGTIATLGAVYNATCECQNGDYNSIGKSITLAAIGAGIGCFAPTKNGSGNTDAVAAGATFGLSLGLASAAAHNEPVKNCLKRIPCVNYIFTDLEGGKSQTGATARSAVAYLAISAALIPAAEKLTGCNIKQFTMR